MAHLNFGTISRIGNGPQRYYSLVRSMDCMINALNFSERRTTPPVTFRVTRI